MGISDIFYSLREPDNIPDWKIACYSEKEGDNPFESVYCPKYKGHQRAKRPPSVPLRLIIPNNNYDLITTWYSDWLINVRVANLLKEHNITGYKLADIVIRDDKRRGDNFNKNLFELVVTGSGGNIHPSSGHQVISVCEYCGHVKFKAFDHGIIVNEKDWDGLDIFTVKEYPKFILVTPKVKKLFEDNHVTGCQFVLANDLKSK